MSDIAGLRAIVNIAQKDRVMDAESEKLMVGNPREPGKPSQMWTVTKAKGEKMYAIFNTGFKMYLAWQRTISLTLRLVLSKSEFGFWEIEEKGNYHKILVSADGTVCSLTSSEPHTPVVIERYEGPNEEWILELLPEHQPITGPTRIKSVAFPDRALTVNGSQTTVIAEAPHNQAGPKSDQRWTISEPSSDATYTIRDDYGQYLGSDGEKAIVSGDKQLWNIMLVDPKGYYKLDVHNVGTVCSLRSNDEGAQVYIGNYLNTQEEWTLEPNPVQSREV